MKRLVSDSIASLDGRLRPNDLICTINGRNLKGMTQGDALKFLKDIPKVINLGVQRSDDLQKTNESVDTQLTTSSSSTVTVSSERKSRSKTKDPALRRSRSETRDQNKSHSEPQKQRPRSVSRLSRFFGGSRDSMNTAGKEQKQSPQIVKKEKKKPGKCGAQLFTVFFDKTERDAFDFTLTGGVNTMYGDSSVKVDSIKKGSEISNTLKVKDELVSIEGVDVSKFSLGEAWNYLLALPVGRVCIVVERR